MSDISKCNGNGYDLREECYRFTAPACDYRQSWIIPPAVGEACEYRLSRAIEMVLARSHVGGTVQHGGGPRVNQGFQP